MFFVFFVLMMTSNYLKQQQQHVWKTRENVFNKINLENVFSRVVIIIIIMFFNIKLTRNIKTMSMTKIRNQNLRKNKKKTKMVGFYFLHNLFPPFFFSIFLTVEKKCLNENRA